MLGGILKAHWGAVGHDLVAAGLTWKDIGTRRLPVGEFVSWVCNAPPGTAVYYQRNEGWLVGDHLTAMAVDALHQNVWFKTVDAHAKSPQHRPEPIARPGVKLPERKPEHKAMTVAEYAAKAGLTLYAGGGE